MKAKIFMVEDEEDFSALARRWLEPAYVFRAFKSGEEFMDALSPAAPDAVILDLYLPGLDGFELCRRLHAVPGLEAVPVLFLTGSERVDDYRKSMAAGGNTYLMKPTGRAQLLAAIAYLLPQTSLRKDGGSD